MLTSMASVAELEARLPLLAAGIMNECSQPLYICNP